MKFDIQVETAKLQENDAPENIHKLVMARLKKIHYKLYQYCSFDSTRNPFSESPRNSKTNLYFKNVLNGQIYASKPSRFNDPFDCIIGVSTQTILSAIVMSFLNGDYLQPKINKGEVKRMLNGEINHQRAVETLSHRAPNLVNDVILGILNNKYVQNRLNQANKKKIGQDELRKLFAEIFQDKEFIGSFVSHFIKPKFMSDGTAKKIQSLLTSSSMMMSNLMLGPAKMDFDENGKIVDFSLSLDKLENIATSQGYDVTHDTQLLKDNLEVAYDVAKNGLGSFYKNIDEQIGVTCFSEKGDIPLMWSHYANRHTGFVIEYDFSNLSVEDSQKLGFLFKVKYSQRRPNLDNRLLEEVDLLNKEFNYKDTLLGSMISTIYTKSNIWRYEKEWRNLMLVKYTDDRRISLKYISRILLGVKLPDKSLKHFKKLQEVTGIKLDRYKLDDDTFKLILHENFTLD
jgi:hypothetical protein